MERAPILLLPLALLLSGCGATVRLAVGPTVDTDGHVGVLARLGGGYAAGLGRRPTSALIVAAAGEGGYSRTWGGFGGGGVEVDYLYQPPVREAGEPPSRAPAVRAGLRSFFYGMEGPGAPPLRSGGLAVAVMGALASSDRSESQSFRFSDSSKGGGFGFQLDWLTRLYLGAELDASLLATNDPHSPAKGQLGLLLALDWIHVAWLGR